MAKIEVDVTALTQQFTSEMAKVQKQLSALESHAAKFGNFASGVTKFFAAFASISAIENTVKSIVTFTDAVSETVGAQSRLAARLGLSAEFVERLDQAFAKSHVDIELAHTALEKFTKIVGKADTGNAEAIQSFAEIGISLADIKRSKPEDLFLQVAGAISKLKNSAQQEDVLTSLFGRGSGEILNLFQKGPENLKHLLAGAKPLTDDMRANFESLDKSTLSLNAAWSELSKVAANEFAPSVTSAIEILTGGLKLATENMATLGKIASNALLGPFKALDGIFATLGLGSPLGETLAGVKAVGKTSLPGTGFGVPKEHKLETGEKIDAEFNRQLYPVKRESDAMQAVFAAMRSGDAHGELRARTKASNLDLRPEILEMKTLQEFQSHQAEASLEILNRNKALSAVGNRRLEIETSINQQYRYATDKQKAAIAGQERQMELAQKLKSILESTGAGGLHKELIDIADMKGISIDRRKDLKQQALDKFNVAYGGREDQQAKYDRLHGEVNHAYNAGDITGKQAQKAHRNLDLQQREDKEQILQSLGKELTPLEQFGTSITKLQTALANGEISQGEASRAIGDLGAKTFDLGSPRLSSAAESGSQDAYKTIVSSMYGNQNLDPQMQTARNSAQTNVLLQQLVNTVGGRRALGLDDVF